WSGRLQVAQLGATALPRPDDIDDHEVRCVVRHRVNPVVDGHRVADTAEPFGEQRSDQLILLDDDDAGHAAIEAPHRYARVSRAVRPGYKCHRKGTSASSRSDLDRINAALRRQR